MPPKNKVERLPAAVLQAVEERIVEQRFDGYDRIAEWLEEQGFDIPAASLYQHGRKLKQKPPSLTAVKVEMKQLGISTKCSDQELQRILVRLGWLRMQEQMLMRKILL